MLYTDIQLSVQINNVPGVLYWQEVIYVYVC